MCECEEESHGKAASRCEQRLHWCLSTKIYKCECLQFAYENKAISNELMS